MEIVDANGLRTIAGYAAADAMRREVRETEQAYGDHVVV